MAREMARRGDRDGAIPLMRAAVETLFAGGRLLAWGVPTAALLVHTLLERGADSDVAEVEAVIERLATAPSDDGQTMRDVVLLRLRALLARAHGDTATHESLRDRYRETVTSLGLQGQIAWAAAMA